MTKKIEHRGQQIIDGMTLLMKYLGPEQLFPVSAEHDILYFSVKPDAPSAKDQKLLKKNGWFKDEDMDCWAFFT